MNRRIQRLLLGCVASNALFGGAGVALIEQSSTATGVPVVANKPTTTMATNAATTADAAAPNLVSAPTTQAAPTAARATSPAKPRSVAKPTTSPASTAVDNATGIASSTAPSAPARVAPSLGSYAVDIAGSASVGGRAQNVPSTGALIFGAAGNEIRQSSPKAPGDVVLLQRFSGAKSELVTLELTAGDMNKVFSPSAPVTYLLYNAPSGTSWNWSADSTDGKTRVAATGRVGDTKDITIGGVSLPAVEVVHELRISGDISGTATLTTWASPEYRLPLVQHQQINASTRGLLGLSIRLVSDTTTTLRSVRPA